MRMKIFKNTLLNTILNTIDERKTNGTLISTQQLNIYHHSFPIYLRDEACVVELHLYNRSLYEIVVHYEV